MKQKRIISLFLAVVLLLALAAPVCAASPGLSNFKKQTEYTGFSDVPIFSWYEESVDSDGTIHYECGICGETMEEKCGCVCHKDGIYKIFYKLIRAFWKLLRVKRFCDCSIEHY